MPNGVLPSTEKRTREKRSPTLEGPVELLLLTTDPKPDTVLPALALLSHGVQVAAADVSALLATSTPVDGVLIDARTDLVGARNLCRLLNAADRSIPVIAVVTEGGLVAVNEDWGIDDILLPGAGPAEIDARLRLLAGRGDDTADGQDNQIVLGELVIDEVTYTARVRGRPLNLTYKEFELLKYLTQHVGRVFTRVQLLQEVWGYDFFGGTRTVDVHVRRLRAKLGPEYESVIGTVRNVGYKAVHPVRGRPSEAEAVEAAEAAEDAEPADA